MRTLIEYFSNRLVIANAIMFGIIFSATVFWKQIGKEELPEFTMNFLRISIVYPGASAEDVELFVTKPIEEKLKGITSIDSVNSTSAYGSSSFRIEFDSHIPDLSEKVQEVKDAVNTVPLPREAEDPVYFQFRNTEKAILDLGFFFEDIEILTVQDRIELQKQVLAFKNHLISLPAISGVDKTGYLLPELHIKVDPQKMDRFEISMDQIKSQIQQQHVRRPIGSLKDSGESEVTIISELLDPESLGEVIVTSGFQGQQVRLNQLAKVDYGFSRSTSVVKIQGKEGIILNVKKSMSVDIITAQKAVVEFLDRFNKSNKSSLKVIIMDDESFDVRNRLSIVGTNGIVGFILIVVVLFVFLDLRTGFWVAMGIPFSLGLTLMLAVVAGFTVNNITLASIIIVLGIVVDDAIIVGENIQRRQLAGDVHAAVTGTYEVLKPIIASILTTCAAFLPMYFFQGHFGLFVKYIPTVVMFMLFASLYESAFILPAHLKHKKPLSPETIRRDTKGVRHRIQAFMEGFYTSSLSFVLRFRIWVALIFVGLFISSLYIMKENLKFSMFPREESLDFRVRVEAEDNLNRYDMARLIGKVESMFIEDENKAITVVRTIIGQSRRGGQVRENRADMRIEILPPTERELSLNELFEIWKEKTKEIPGIKEVKFIKARFGAASGSPIEIEIQENNDVARSQASESIKEYLSSLEYLENVEIERPIVRDVFELNLKKSEVSRLNVNYQQLTEALRAYVEGDVLYTLNNGEEEVDIRFTTSENHKDDIDDLLNLRIANRENYLVPIKNLVVVEKKTKPSNISRIDYKRTTSIYADFAANKAITPLELAKKLESELLPRLYSEFPTTIVNFKGEIKDSRESQADFIFSLLMILVLVYIILVFLFNSVFTPLLIASIIPFGIVGVIYAFWLQNINIYGFFAVIGALGMIGVVINDAIVLINKLEVSLERDIVDRKILFSRISEIAATRLRAIVLTTVTTVAGVFPTAYGLGGFDAMLSEMMMALGWGLVFGMFITLGLIPILYSYYYQGRRLGSRFL